MRDQLGDIPIPICEVDRVRVPDVKMEHLLALAVFEQRAPLAQPRNRFVKLVLRDLEGVMIQPIPIKVRLEYERRTPDLKREALFRVFHGRDPQAPGKERTLKLEIPCAKTQLLNVHAAPSLLSSDADGLSGASCDRAYERIRW